MTTTASGYSKKTRLFFIHDSCQEYKFLVDTAARISVVPLTTKNNLTPALYKLQAANGIKINTYGE